MWVKNVYNRVNNIKQQWVLGGTDREKVKNSQLLHMMSVKLENYQRLVSPRL
jgi:hypothetical protein